MKYTEKLLCLLGLLHFSSTQSSTGKKYCIMEESPKPVTFSSLLEFQNTRRSFNVLKPSYQGNVVNFNFKSVDRIIKNTFISFDSDSIIKISLNDKGIRTIDDGAFNGLFCLRYLDLKGNNISSLTEDAFQGLENLWELNLSENFFNRVFENGLVLHYLSNLKVLNLSRNEIRTLNTFAFLNLAKLEVLDLGFNKIRTFSPNIFNSLQSLKDLYLNNNYLIDIEPHKWNCLNNLKFLDLAHNSLNKFDPTYNFSFFGLQKLNLSGNYLSSLNAFELKRNLAKLELIDISENNWMCDELENVKHQLMDSKITLLGGVNCSSSGEYKRLTTERIIYPSTQITIGTTRVTKKMVDYSKEVYVQNSEILFTDKKILNNVQYLQTLIVYLFVVVVLFIVIHMFVRIGFCQNLYNRMTEGNRVYLDGNDREHLVLMRG